MAIYFIQADKGGPIKIGYSGKPFARLNLLQVSQHVELKMVALIEGDRKLEGDLHQQFGKHHLRGEWFNPGPELLKYLSALPVPTRPKRHQKFTLATDPKVVDIWFDMAIRTDVEAAKRIGHGVMTIKGHLGKSGRGDREGNASMVAAHAAKSSPRSTAKQGRMPHKEAQPYLCKVEFTVAECCEIINAVRDAKGKKKYSVPWNEGFAYREKRGGRIDFPKRAAGPRTK